MMKRKKYLMFMGNIHSLDALYVSTRITAVIRMITLLLSASFFVLFLPFLCFFRDVAFSEYYCTLLPLSLCIFSLSDGVFQPCDHGLDY